MNSIKLTIAVIYGGPSSESEISKLSAQAVIRSLRDLKYDVLPIEWSREIKSQLLHTSIDLAFILIHGVYGEDGQIQILLEELGIPYIGSNPKSSKVAFNKVKTKKILEGQGITCAPYTHLKADNLSMDIPFEYPVICKPLEEGSSIGIKIINNEEENKIVFNEMSKQYKEWIIEPYLKGREFTVGIINDKALPVIEIIPDKGFFDYQNKYVSNKTVYEVPAKIPSYLEERLQDVALKSYFALECQDLARVDFIYFQDNMYVLEINTIPGFTEKSLLPKAAKAAGYNFNELCESLIAHAMKRWKCGLKI